VAVRHVSHPGLLPLATDLGPGESEVLALGVEMPGSLVVLDDGLARRYAHALGLRLTGTLGVLLRAKRGGLLPEIAPILRQLDSLRFRLDPDTCRAVLKLAGE
jgi:predicted nucleic acid-binding protein